MTRTDTLLDLGDCWSTFGPCLSWGTFVCAVAVSVPGWVGLYLFRTGCDDYTKGCTECMNKENWACRRLNFLKSFLPLTTLVRIFCAPAMWFYFSSFNEYHRPPLSLAVILWIVNFLISWGLFAEVILKPGWAHVLSSHLTMDLWPQEHAVNRPYHGLASTRCHALNGGFWAELLWTLWIIANYADPHTGTRIAGVTIPVVIFTGGMIFGGPVNFLARKPDKDLGVAQAYILVAVFSVEGMLLLNHAWFGIRVAINPVSNASSLGPYGHWSVILWNAILIAQIVICRAALGAAVDLKPGAPWSAGGADHKEFYFPRFWGLIYFSQGMVIGFNLWVLGNWIWAEEAVAYRGWTGA
jgi:hypothetical protein